MTLGLLAVAAAWGQDRVAAGEIALPTAGEVAPIINGAPALQRDWPMTGGLLVSADIDLYGLTLTTTLLMCTSTLIAPDVVLTAAHCVDLESMLDLYGYDGLQLSNLRFGWSREADLTAWTGLALENPWPDTTAVGSIAVPHDRFSLAALEINLAKNFDIALVFLDEPVLDVPFAWLPTEAEADEITPGRAVEIVGWGQQTAEDAGSVGVKYIAESVIGEVAPYEIQIGDSPDDGRKCHGDSGGPTYLRLENGGGRDPWRVIGVTSHAYDFTDCASKGGVDTRVDFYLDWIEEQLTTRCADGTRSWCDEPGIPQQIPGDSLTLVTTQVPSSELRSGCDVARGASGGFAALLALLATRRRRCA